MSYILDALKKSEQERGHGNIPDVQTVHSSSLNYHREKKSYWPYFLIAAVILNLLAIIYFNFDKSAGTESEVAAPLVVTIESLTTPENTKPEISQVKTNNASTIKIEIRDEKLRKSSTLNNEINSPVEIKKQAPVITEKTAAESVTSNSLNIVEFYDLPEATRQAMPAIIISAHIYSSNPEQRSIVINNNFMEEGGYVLDDLILYEITADGAIFNYNGILFNYGVVSGWQ